MIQTSMQVKALIRNKANGDSDSAFVLFQFRPALQDAEILSTGLRPDPFGLFRAHGGIQLFPKVFIKLVSVQWIHIPTPKISDFFSHHILKRHAPR
ncbi:MAG: hypothetical protein IJI14_16355 [Anaerolineaceae bacterium]|nr:hypothetical protein [Anaerolineaceae bacterium]